MISPEALSVSLPLSAPWLGILCPSVLLKLPNDNLTSKGSYRSWKKIVKVWMLMMKEGIFAGRPSLALNLLALNPLAFAPLHSPLPR